MRKLCTSPHHEGPRWLLSLYFHAKGRDSEGNPKLLQSHCAACQRVNTRIRGGHRPRKPSRLGLVTDRNGYKIRSAKDRERYNEYRRRYYRQMSNKRKESRREYDRIRAEAKRREQGISPRRFSKEREAPDSNIMAFLPVEPLREYVLSLPQDRVVPKLTSWQRKVLIEGERDQITLDFADAVLLELDCPWKLEELYPLESN